MDKYTSELNAVNAVLRAIGEAPVQTLEDSDLVDAHMAYSILQEVSREIQAEGWAWNTVRRKKLKPDQNGIIHVPNSALWIRGIDKWLTMVGGRVVEMVEGEDRFKSPVEVEIVYFREWQDLPEIAKRYIVTRSARKFAEEAVGDAQLSEFKAQDEVMLRADLVDMDSEMNRANMKNAYDVFSMTEGRDVMKTGVNLGR